MYKHLVYSFKGKISLYILYLLTIVIATIVSIYCLNSLLSLNAPSAEKSFDASADYDLYELNGHIERGEICAASESINYVEVIYTDSATNTVNKNICKIARESTNKMFQINNTPKYGPRDIIFSSSLKDYHKSLTKGDTVLVGGIEYNFFGYSADGRSDSIGVDNSLMLLGDIYIPYNETPNANPTYTDFGRSYSQIRITFPTKDKLNNELKTSLSTLGYTESHGFNFSSYTFYAEYLPNIAMISVGLLCVFLMYGYIRRQDKTLDTTIYKAVGANHTKHLLTLNVENALIYSIGFSVGCAIMMTLFYLLRANTACLITGLVLFLMWLAYIMLFAIYLVVTNIKAFQLADKRPRRRHRI